MSTVNRYGNDTIDPTGPIPAHLMGNMWAQSWNNLATILRPYPNKPSIDVTEPMKDQGWTPKIMFQKADEFFISLGLDPMPEVSQLLTCRGFCSDDLIKVQNLLKQSILFPKNVNSLFSVAMSALHLFCSHKF